MRSREEIDEINLVWRNAPPLFRCHSKRSESKDHELVPVFDQILGHLSGEGINARPEIGKAWQANAGGLFRVS